MMESVATPKVAGIDPSLTKTAVVVGDGSTWKLKEFSSRNLGSNVRARTDRYDGLADNIVKFLKENGPLEAIFIEGYAFAKNDAGSRWTVEFGGILRWHLVDLADRVYEVAPATLKKFVTGKGNSPKDVILAHIQKRWGELFNSNDAGDAFGLYKLGLVVEGINEADNTALRKAAAKVTESVERIQRSVS